MAAFFHDPHKIKIRGDGRLILIGCIHGICHDFPFHTILSLNKNSLLPIQVAVPFIKVQALFHTPVRSSKAPLPPVTLFRQNSGNTASFPPATEGEAVSLQLDILHYGSCPDSGTPSGSSSCRCHRQNNRFLSSLTS